jgi:hypothetical protein
LNGELKTNGLERSNRSGPGGMAAWRHGGKVDIERAKERCILRP